MPGSGQSDSGSGAPTAERLVTVLRRKPLTPRRAAVLIATFTVVVTFAGALVGWLADRKDFDNFGNALWWSLQTVTTVGYGDIVPSRGIGRVIGGFVMISGIAFLTVITAAVTAALIEAARRRRQPPDREPLAELMQEMSARLSAIEARLDEQGSQADD
jgi:voltage-gated potassium channel Kch